MKINLICFLVGIALGAFLLYSFFWPNYTETVKITEKIEWVKKDTTIFHYKDSIRFKIVETKPSLEPEKYDSIRVYKGVELFDYGSLSWEAKTSGSLDFLEFKPSIYIPTTIKTMESVKSFKSKSLYAQTFVSSQMSFEMGLSYVNDKTIISYSYSPRFKQHKIGIGIKIIGK